MENIFSLQVTKFRLQVTKYALGIPENQTLLTNRARAKPALLKMRILSCYCGRLLCLINDGEIHFVLVWLIFQNTRKIHIAQFNRPINI